MIPTTKMFIDALDVIIRTAQENKKEYVDVISKDLHILVGGYFTSNHRMPACCSAMRQKKKAADQVLSAPPKGNGSEFKIRYYL